MAPHWRLTNASIKVTISLALSVPNIAGSRIGSHFLLELPQKGGKLRHGHSFASCAEIVHRRDVCVSLPGDCRGTCPFFFANVCWPLTYTLRPGTIRDVGRSDLTIATVPYDGARLLDVYVPLKGREDPPVVLLWHWKWTQ